MNMINVLFLMRSGADIILTLLAIVFMYFFLGLFPTILITIAYIILNIYTEALAEEMLSVGGYEDEG